MSKERRTCHEERMGSTEDAKIDGCGACYLQDGMEGYNTGT